MNSTEVLPGDATPIPLHGGLSKFPWRGVFLFKKNASALSFYEEIHSTEENWYRLQTCSLETWSGYYFKDKAEIQIDVFQGDECRDMCRLLRRLFKTQVAAPVRAQKIESISRCIFIGLFPKHG